MIITSRNSTNKNDWPVAPEGAEPATIKNVKDLGIRATNFGDKHQLRLDWLLDKLSDDGRELMVFQTFTASLGDKSNLRKAIRQILGRDPGPEYDTDDLIGRRATLVLGHDEGSGGRVYANVRAILTLREGAGQ